MSESNQNPDIPKTSLLESRKFTYIFLISLLLYTLVCGYVLVFSGSLFFEAMVKGWWRSAATDYDNRSFLLGYLYGFPSLLGFFGGVAVLSTGWRRFYRFKVLFFVPAAVWSTQLVLGNFRWGLTYWTEWLYLGPIMALAIFVLYCVVKQVDIPFLQAKTGAGARTDNPQA